MLRPLIQQNLHAVHQRIERAARSVGREPAEIRLVAVTKSVPAAVALEVARCGETDLGENRREGLEEKVAAFESARAPVRWHFIGHLQRNKARRVVRLADAIHSVDSLRLIETLDRLAEEEGRRPEIFLEVKLSPEASKQGFEPAELSSAARKACDAPHLAFSGLMTMAPAPPSRRGTPVVSNAREEQAGNSSPRAVFDELVRLGRELDSRFAGELEHGRVQYSMGMSGDYETAIEAGSDYVRVGSALYRGLDVQAGIGR